MLNEIKKILFLFFAIMLTTVIGVSNVVAEDDPLTKKNSDIANQVYTGQVTGGKLGKNQNSGIGSSTNLGGTENAALAEEKVEDSKIAKDEPIKVRPNEKQQDFHTYIPKRQFNRMINSKEWEKMYDEAVSGSTNNNNGAASMIGAVTWGLANSAVGQARYNAISQTHQALMNHYLAELSFIKQVEQNPQMSQSITDAYFTCVRKKMNEMNNNHHYTWFEAQEICMGDDSDIQGNDKIDPELFNYKEILDLEDSSNGEKVCLTDYLFNQEAGKGKNENNNDGEEQESLTKLKTAYQSFIGDVLFKIKEDNNRNSDVIGVRKINYKFIFPGGDLSDCSGNQSDEDATPYKLYKKLVAHRYEQLVTTLGNFCQQVKRNGDVEKFLGLEDTQKFFEYFQRPGFAMDLQVVQNLYALAEEYASRSDDGKISCNIFSDLINSIEEDLLKYGNSSSDDKDPSKVYKTVYYKFANVVATSTLFSAYNIMYGYLQNTTIASFGENSEIYQIAMKQIGQVVQNTLGISDISRTDEINKKSAEVLMSIKEGLNDYQNANTKGLASDLSANGQANDKPSEALYN